MTPPASTSRPPTRTPDQRLRVFVSSTLKELAPERKAVFEAAFEDGRRMSPAEAVAIAREAASAGSRT